MFKVDREDYCSEGEEQEELCMDVDKGSGSQEENSYPGEDQMDFSW